MFVRDANDVCSLNDEEFSTNGCLVFNRSRSLLLPLFILFPLLFRLRKRDKSEYESRISLFEV